MGKLYKTETQEQGNIIFKIQKIGGYSTVYQNWKWISTNNIFSYNSTLWCTGYTK